MKRFWTQVTVDAGQGVFLDGRPVRTPGRQLLALPTTALAEAVADEWLGVGDSIDPRAMPFTGLANAAIDRIGPDPATFAAGLARYGESDLLLYRAETPEPLVERQRAAWDPPLAWARKRYDIGFEPVAGIIHHPQPAATVARLAAAVAALPPFRLAGLSPLVTVSGSLVLALMLAEDATTVEEAWAAATLDEAWQAEQWGHDPLAANAEASRRRDFDAGARFLSLL